MESKFFKQKEAIKAFLSEIEKLKFIYSCLLAFAVILIGSVSLYHNLIQNKDSSHGSQISNQINNSTSGDNNTQNNSDAQELPNTNSGTSDNSNTTSGTQQNGSSSTNNNSSKSSTGGSTPTTPTNPTPTPTPEPVPTPEPTPEPEPEPEPETLSATVAFYADSQSDTDAEDAYHQNVVNRILASGANPVFHAGDLMEDGTQDSLDRFNSVTSTLRASRHFYAALGNNDRKVGDSSTPSQLFFDNFSFPNNERWYSVNYGNLHLVVLDSAFASGSSSQLSWLANDLQSSASQNRITGIMFHHPTYKSTIASYINNYGVDFVISGHIHSYSHSVSNGVHYFTLSGQPTIGYIKARIYTNHVEMTVYNNAGGVVDTESFEER